jgi:hypothetical protein
MTAPGKVLLRISLNGDAVYEQVGAEITVMVVMRPPFPLDGVDANTAQDRHRSGYRNFLGRMPAGPDEQLSTGASLLLATATVDGNAVGIGFADGDELDIDLVDASEPGAAGTA